MKRVHGFPAVAVGSLFAAGAVCAFAAPAAAQIVGSPDEIALPRTGEFARDQNVSVADRPHPDYAPLGIDLGGFTGEASLDTNLEYNSNIYATPNNDVSDEIFHIAPSFIATSNWSRDSLQFFGRGQFDEYVNHSSESVENGALGVNGRFDVASDLGLAAGATLQQNTEFRTSPNSPALSIHPIQYDLATTYAVAAYEGGHIRLSARYDFQDYMYQNGQLPDGTSLYQRNRDYLVSIGTFRAEYAALPGASIFANLVLDTQENENVRPVLDVSRSNNGYEATIGSNFNLTRLIRGEVFVGYLDTEFKDSYYYRPVQGLSLRGYLQWFPTQLMTVSFSGSRTPVDSDIPTVGAYFDSNVTGRVDYELLRNLLITGSVTFETDDYTGLRRTDTRNYETIKATYLMNRRISLDLTFQHQQNDSTGAEAGYSFDIESLMAGVTFKY